MFHNLLESPLKKSNQNNEEEELTLAHGRSSSIRKSLV